MENVNKKYIVVGAVAGGASAAARLRRLDEHASIILFEKGAYVSYANCGLPYYIGNVIEDRNKLFVQTAQSFHERFNIDVRIQTEVIAVNPEKKEITARDVLTGNIYIESYDKLVLSPGAEPVVPPFPGVQSNKIFTLRNVPDTDTIKSFVSSKKNAKALVIGAGFIGLEMAENLHHLGHEVTVVEMNNQILAPLDFPIAAIAQQHLREKGLELMLNTAVESFEDKGETLLVNFKGGMQMEVDYVILSIGVRPDTRLAAAAGLQIGEARGIVVNEYLQTTHPDIYAVGDAIEFKHPITQKIGNTFLAGPANKQGRICANNIVFNNTNIYNGAINTAIVKLFDLTVGTTGMAAKHLKAAGISYLVSTTRSSSHASYYPNSKQITIQITFSPDTKKLLGAQVIGEDGADKRLDILATLIKNNGTIYDLTELEHAYAPPYSSAKDPVNMAGFVAENILNGILKVEQWDGFETTFAADENAMMIDVRNPDEVVSGAMEGSINIPLDTLRSNLNNIPKDKTIFVYCAVGLRGYLAQRILMQSGYKNVINLSGGYNLWNVCKTELQLSEKNIQHKSVELV
ncbi:MAG: Coenzyme disulfide reductase [Bacteroidota bacterium]|jgi:NADPH-dependent 2,4-dienoyl-CoA reductase/sulfur reductase-like enzyme/rhodanese-related sulfurtransferase